MYTSHFTWSRPPGRADGLSAAPSCPSVRVKAGLPVVGWVPLARTVRPPAREVEAIPSSPTNGPDAK
jgi:hypothetical protein